MKKAGFSLLELVIAAAILGLLFTMLAMFLGGQQKITGQQITAVSMNNDSRLALTRMADMVAQASFIYPAGQVITLQTLSGSKQVVTGKDALAVLIAGEASQIFCPTTTQSYCGYIWLIDDRTEYLAFLGEHSSATNHVLVEFKVPGLVWPQGINPAQGLLNWTQFTASISPVVDSVDQLASSLAAAENLRLAAYRSRFDGEKNFNGTSVSAADALVSSVEVSLALTAHAAGKTSQTKRSAVIFARSVPREALPKPGP